MRNDCSLYTPVVHQYNDIHNKIINNHNVHFSNKVMYRNWRKTYQFEGSTSRSTVVGILQTGHQQPCVTMCPRIGELLNYKKKSRMQRQTKNKKKSIANPLNA